MDEGGGDLGPLLVAEGELLDGLVAALGQFEAVDELIGPHGRVARAHSAQAGEVDELLVHAHLGV